MSNALEVLRDGALELKIGSAKPNKNPKVLGQSRTVPTSMPK